MKREREEGKDSAGAREGPGACGGSPSQYSESEKENSGYFVLLLGDCVCFFTSTRLLQVYLHVFVYHVLVQVSDPLSLRPPSSKPLQGCVIYFSGLTGVAAAELAHIAVTMGASVVSQPGPQVTHAVVSERIPTYEHNRSLSLDIPLSNSSLPLPRLQGPGGAVGPACGGREAGLAP
jgi:hypothetical protein